MRSPDTMPARLLYVVSEDWYFLSHRLPMARAAREAGFEVHVATRVVDGGDAIEAQGFILHPIPFVRGRFSPSAALRTIVALRRLHRSIDPAICHHVALQVCVLGSLAAIGKRAGLVNALTGLGYAFMAGGIKARSLRALLGGLFRFLFVRERALVLVQNQDDRRTLEAIGIPQSNIALVPGSGVDCQRLQPLPEPAGAPAVGYVGRLLDDKGVRVLVAAHRLLRRRGIAAELLLAGTPDPANPASLPQAEIDSWKREPGIHLLGFVDDIAGFWARAHIAALPSRREGLPKSLLEAAACGRPMVASDVPGCREIVRPGETGALVPPDDPGQLAAALETLIGAPELRQRYGAAARRLVVEHFDDRLIGRQIVDVYRRLADPRAPGAAIPATWKSVS